MNIVFDNIIFSLQRAGGVSALWNELITEALGEDNLNKFFLEYKNSELNVFRRDLIIKKDLIINKSNQDSHVHRFLDLKGLLRDKYVFHSSFFRISNDRNAVNVTTVHDFIYEKYRKGIPRIIHVYQKKKALYNSDAIICVSNNTKIDLLEYYPKIDEGKINVIHNGVSDDFTLLNIDKPASINNLGRYVLYVGNRKQVHKNFQPIILALSKFSDFKLVMVGGGILEKLEIAILDKNICSRYIHFNNITNKELNILYNFAFAFLYPSIYEGFGIPIIEAQKAGCPVIATKGSSIDEVVLDSALLNELGTSDEIYYNILKLEDTEFRNGVIHKGLINSNRFSWKTMAKEVISLYRSLL